MCMSPQNEELDPFPIELPDIGEIPHTPIELPDLESLAPDKNEWMAMLCKKLSIDGIWGELDPGAGGGGGVYFNVSDNCHLRIGGGMGSNGELYICCLSLRIIF